MSQQAPHDYTICNGLANQLLGHLAGISNALRANRPVRIPDTFIIHGVQDKEAGNGALVDVKPTQESSVPLSSIIDTDALLAKIATYGIDATLVPYQEELHGQIACSWLNDIRTADHAVALDLLVSLRPAKHLSELVERIGTAMETSGFSRADTVCVHHRDGPDWHKHCDQWSAIKDGVWRQNCREDRNMSLVDLVRQRIPVGKKSNIYYVGDHAPPDELLSSGMTVTTREQLLQGLNDEQMLSALHIDPTTLSSPTTYRDLWAAIDFFACSQLDHFIGNSVSTWSALQIAKRNTMMATWYNSRSIPVGSFFKVFNVPIVYAYTEASTGTGKSMLKVSILSARKHMPAANINILYNGSTDTDFMTWLTDHGVVIHHHEPVWKDAIEHMRLSGDPRSSHLYQHSGNYLGTWQRIDIPLFIDAEYCLYLDMDTVVVRPFTLDDFGLDIPAVLAFSSEMDESVNAPTNAGVALLNVPRLRESYDSFLHFIESHADGKFDAGPSDQGAYLDYYKDDIKYLDRIFNFKPYSQSTKEWEDVRVVHFHGSKPHDFLGSWLGIECPLAVQMLCTNAGQYEYLCPSLKIFAEASLLEGDGIIRDYCKGSFGSVRQEQLSEVCFSFFDELAKSQDVTNCQAEILLPLQDVLSSRSAGIGKDVKEAAILPPSVSSVSLLRVHSQEFIQTRTVVSHSGLLPSYVGMLVAAVMFLAVSRIRKRKYQAWMDRKYRLLTIER